MITMTILLVAAIMATPIVPRVYEAVNEPEYNQVCYEQKSDSFKPCDLK